MHYRSEMRTQLVAVGPTPRISRESSQRHKILVAAYEQLLAWDRLLEVFEDEQELNEIVLRDVVLRDVVIYQSKVGLLAIHSRGLKSLDGGSNHRQVTLQDRDRFVGDSSVVCKGVPYHRDRFETLCEQFTIKPTETVKVLLNRVPSQETGELPRSGGPQKLLFSIDT